ncbi:MAG: hypothetical protein H5T76_36530, partial [Streptomyces sp.]|nr:hypothetical protein [Streptomyces sp.]
MNKWREDAQPEWPEVASPTGSTAAGDGAGISAGGGDTRAVPETSGFDAFSRRDRFQPAAGAEAGDAAETAVLPPLGADAVGGVPGARTGSAAVPAPGSAAGVVPVPGPAAGAVVRDPWAEAEPEPHTRPAPQAPDDGVTHDPHEVTVQLDAVQFGAGRLSPAAGVPDTTEPDAAGPVFVDETGRR